MGMDTLVFYFMWGELLMCVQIGEREWPKPDLGITYIFISPQIFPAIVPHVRT